MYRQQNIQATLTLFHLFVYIFVKFNQLNKDNLTAGNGDSFN